MRQTIFITLFLAIALTTPAFGTVTVFFRDGSREIGDSAWLEGSMVYLSRSETLYEFPVDEVLLEETQKGSRIGNYAERSLPDSRARKTAGARSHDLVERLMKGAGFDRQIDLFIQQFETGVRSSAANGELAGIFDRALAAFDPERAKRKIRAYYRSHLDSATMERVLAWSQTPLGVKIAAAQESSGAMSPEMAQQVLMDLERNPPSARRWALIGELDKAGRATETAQQVIVDAIGGVAGAIPGGTADRKAARREILRKIQSKKHELAPLLRKQIQAGLANSYRDLSDGELRDYTTFLRSEPARKFSRATMGALGEMTRDMSASMMRQMVKVVGQKRGREGY
ncbi:DUF2059 domain-containing protein [Pelobacter propionicus]|uniref:DUF2059 domain-containing protein n=1 Tax=Pelobacter propionicus (strain DSM 2379 / NBRC 103807 / OttBd1) TaxID=338966 RepID=A1AR21_PELPD|nr:DUF2059 domain-containing protein [Pelobacter propionicus]ABK99791.1 hypothetical protein Ppro_2183 [Pelobacter propionicus DSM 2379]